MSGRLKHQGEEVAKPLQFLWLWGKARREQPANVTVTKRHELCHSASAGTETGGHLPGMEGVFPGLE